MPKTTVLQNSLATQENARPVEHAEPVDFDCTLRDDGYDAAWVHLGGELDIATSPLLERTLSEAQLRARLIVLDLRELAFIDCCGVHAILTAKSRAQQAGRRLILARGPSQVDRVLTLTGASAELEIFDHIC